MKWLMQLFKRRIPTSPIILKGGRRPIEVAIIKRKRPLGGDAEGHVYEIKVVVKKGRKGRMLRLAEKEFYQKKGTMLEGLFPSLRDPIRQFETMQGLLKLNREKKLGLRIIPTIRLREQEGKAPTLIITKLKEISWEKLSQRQKLEFKADQDRQVEIGKQNTYLIRNDAFVPVFEQNGKVIAVITDFGCIMKQQS